MGFVLISNPAVKGADGKPAHYPAPELSVPDYETKGWKLVAGRDKDKNLKDVRGAASDFEEDLLTMADGSVVNPATAEVVTK